MKNPIYLTYTSSFWNWCISKAGDKIYKKLTSLIALENLKTVLDNGVVKDSTHNTQIILKISTSRKNNSSFRSRCKMDRKKIYLSFKKK